METKLFEDLEFQQLEKESRLEEEREVLSQQLLLSQGENHRSVVHRKVGPAGGQGSCRVWGQETHPPTSPPLHFS